MTTCFDLWAKTGENGKWHALPYHLLDVGAAARALFERLPEPSRHMPIRSLGDEETALRSVVFLAAVHDIGKANPFFQAKAADQRARLEELRIALPSPAQPEPRRHGQATVAYLKEYLSQAHGWKPFSAINVAQAVGGHHGSFFGDVTPYTLHVHEEPWCRIAPALLADIAGALGVANDLASPSQESLNPFLAWLAGFVSVADWLGSHEAMTAWETRRRPLDEYWNEACHRAEELLRDMKWELPASGSPLAVGDLIPNGGVPNELQTAAQEIAPEYTLAVIEAPTGEGKTEAAFAMVEPYRSVGAGVYFGLPTMATANGLHGRVSAYLQRASARKEEVDTRLLHSMAWLHREPVNTTPNPGEEGHAQDSAAVDWFAGSKRGLLAPYGVGTIDQALIAALRARHGFVRLFALAGKVVVIDEVHAYDVYMSNLLAVLLGWLRALGCRVVLLSATLPSERRNELLETWGCTSLQTEAEYPRITWVKDDGHANARSFEVAPRKPLSFLPVEANNEETWQAGARRLLARVRESGGFGALVVNTVSNAQRAFEHLRSQDDLGDISIDLFHARFTAHDRELIERRILQDFGKHGPRDRPRILVATQVVEQSLDLDFDHMVTDLAPVDLLIQRAGRLHRHRRQADGSLREDGGADERPKPIVEVVIPPLDDQGIPAVGNSIYHPDILVWTERWMSTSSVISKPEDVSRAVESVYSDSSRPGLPAGWEEKMAEYGEKSAVKALRHSMMAGEVTISQVNDEDRMLTECEVDLDENDDRPDSRLAARTRLETRPSISLLLLTGSADGLKTVHGLPPLKPRNAVLATVRASPPMPLWKELIESRRARPEDEMNGHSHSRPLVLTHGSASLDKFEVTYDSTLGLRWRKKDAVV